MRQGRYVHSPPAVRRRRIVTVSAAATPGSRLAVDARRRGGGARHLHAIGPPDRVTIGPGGDADRARRRARGARAPPSRGWPAAAAASWSSRPPPASARPRCSSTPRELAAEAGLPRPPRRARARSSATSRSASCARCSRAPLRDASGDERAHLLDGAAAPAGELLLDGTAPGGDSTMLVAHSVLWLCSALAERRPLALVVDDAQWADRSSLEVLSYLARRDRRPAAADPGRRPRRRPDAASDLLSLLGSVRSATVLHPQPLTPRGAPQLIRRAAPDDAGRRLPRLPSRGRRQPVAAGRARPPDRRARPEALDDPDQDAPRSPRSPAPSSAAGWPSSPRATAASSRRSR